MSTPKRLDDVEMLLFVRGRCKMSKYNKMLGEKKHELKPLNIHRNRTKLEGVVGPKSPKQ